MVGTLNGLICVHIIELFGPSSEVLSKIFCGQRELEMFSYIYWDFPLLSVVPLLQNVKLFQHDCPTSFLRLSIQNHMTERNEFTLNHLSFNMCLLRNFGQTCLPIAMKHKEYCKDNYRFMFNCLRLYTCFILTDKKKKKKKKSGKYFVFWLMTTVFWDRILIFFIQIHQINENT